VTAEKPTRHPRQFLAKKFSRHQIRKLQPTE
jgi:hypothetical protein